MNMRGWFYPGQLSAWTATLVSEGIVAALLARMFGIAQPWKASAAAIFGSLLSHPIVWWLHYEIFLGRVGYWSSFAVVEAFAVLVETPFYRLAGAKWGDALALSFLVNAASVLVGFAMNEAGISLGF